MGLVFNFTVMWEVYVILSFRVILSLCYFKFRVNSKFA